MPTLPMIKIEEKVSSMYRQCYEEEPSQVQEDCDTKVYGENVEKKLQSIINSIGDQSTLLLMAVGGLHCQQEISSRNSHKIQHTKK